MPCALQKISRNKMDFDNDADASKKLSELGIEHGTLLQLDLATPNGDTQPSTASATIPSMQPPSGTTAGSNRGRRRRGTTMADLEAERSEFEVILETPGPAACEYLIVSPDAGRGFSDYVLDEVEFEERRIALLYGRYVDEQASGGKRGVIVDVVYEPPQECTAEIMRLDSSTAAAAELKRAAAVAAALGLKPVGFAYAHPPRLHTLEPSELVSLVEQRSHACEIDPLAKELFVGVRFRAILEGEPIDGDVTAEAYQPTRQAADLVCKKVLTTCTAAMASTDDKGEQADPAGQVALLPASKLSFKIGPKTEPSADLSYFISRVHDLGKPYTPPSFGTFRHAFPVANRGQAPFRKFHLRTFLERQYQAGLQFASLIVDFQLLLFVSEAMPQNMFTKLCNALMVVGSGTRGKIRDTSLADIDAAELWLRNYAGIGA